MRKIVLIFPLFLSCMGEAHATWTPQEVFDQLWARQERKSEENDDNGDLRSPKNLKKAPMEPTEEQKELELERKRIFDLYKQLEPPAVLEKAPRREITPEKPKDDGERK